MEEDIQGRGTLSSTWLKRNKGVPLAFSLEYAHLEAMREFSEIEPAPEGIDTLIFSPPIPIIEDQYVIIRCNLWADGNDLAFLHNGNLIRMEAESFFAGVLEHDAQFREELNARNRRLNLPDPFAAAPPADTPKALSQRIKPLPGNMLFKADNVHAAVVRALSCAGEWKMLDGFAYAVKHGYKGLDITVGLPDSLEAQDLWTFLAKGGASLIKAHYALWGRWYEEGGRPGHFITVNVNQFCSDIGYAPHHRGGFKRERKQEAVRALKALTTVEMNATYTPPNGKKGKTVRLRGPLWSRGLIAEEKDQYSDLFGAARIGDPGLWEPVAFSYAPGPWFQNEDWIRYNKFVGKVGSGLMRLSNHTDEWAILIGGYLGTQWRVNGYGVVRLRASTILSRTNLAQGDDARRRATQYREKFESALNKLQDVKVLTEWKWAGTDAAELTDPDDADAVAEYYSEEPLPRNDWRSQVVEMTMPMEQEKIRLQAARATAITKARRRKSALPKNEG